MASYDFGEEFEFEVVLRNALMEARHGGALPRLYHAEGGRISEFDVAMLTDAVVAACRAQEEFAAKIRKIREERDAAGAAPEAGS